MRQVHLTDSKRVSNQVPRRHGKTWAIAMQMVSTAVKEPGSLQAVVSDNYGARNRMRDIVNQLLQAEGLGDFVVKQNVEEVWILAEPPLTFSKIRFVVSGQQRGYEADYVFADELPYDATQRLFAEIQPSIAVIAVSTPVCFRQRQANL